MLSNVDMRGSSTHDISLERNRKWIHKEEIKYKVTLSKKKITNLRKKFTGSSKRLVSVWNGIYHGNGTRLFYHMDCSQFPGVMGFYYEFCGFLFTPWTLWWLGSMDLAARYHADLESIKKSLYVFAHFEHNGSFFKSCLSTHESYSIRMEYIIDAGVQHSLCRY